MVIGFKKQFVPLIKKGSKIHTIRADKRNRWKAGMKMHMATGVRTKKYKCFKQNVCKSIQKIKIKYSPKSFYGKYIPSKIYIDGKSINFVALCELSKNDGFETVSDFLDWFNKDFKGKIIHWTDKKY